MKKINKTQGNNPLSEYAKANPNENWDSFRNSNAASDYKFVRQLMLNDQGGLCGYCEKKISEVSQNKQRVEHYHSKSDLSNPNKNWALDWQNVFAVCIGGNDANKSAHPLPENLSCDSYKDHLITAGKLDAACEGYLLNPLRIVSSASLFLLDKSSGSLTVDIGACQQLADIDNQYENLESLVEKTIEILNLNCQRLLDDRLEVLKRYNQEVTKARKANDKEGLTKLAHRWFHSQWPSFFTTRRILLGQNAEAYLARISYSG